MGDHTEISEFNSIDRDLVKFEYVTHKTVDVAIQILLSKMQWVKEPTSNDSEIPEDLKEIKTFFRDIASFKHSVIAIDKRNNKVLGVTFNMIRLQKYPKYYSYFKDIDKTENIWLKNLIELLEKVENNSDSFNKLSVDWHIQMIGIAMLSSYHTDAMYSLLIEGTCDLIRNNKYHENRHPQTKILLKMGVKNFASLSQYYLSTVMMGNETSKIKYEGFGFTNIATVQEDELTVDGTNLLHMFLDAEYGDNVYFMVNCIKL